jgi:chemotaxis protein methyltransferase CheR
MPLNESTPGFLVNEEELRRLCDFLYRHTGMILSESKRYFVERRVLDRMGATGTDTFEAYFDQLRGGRPGELEHFINAFTVNETYFYREDYQFQCLTNDLLKLRVAGKRPGESVRLWSIPCATGEEPFSLAIWLLENWPAVDSFNVEIFGSDIDTKVLHAAKAGIYGERALMRLSPQLVTKYFEKIEPQQWQIIQDIRDSIQFSAVNVLDMAETRRHGSFDVIFCRNMLIYFDDASRRRAAENLYECLLPGGFICLGHTESMSRISSLFEVARFNDAVVYRRAPRGGGNE